MASHPTKGSQLVDYAKKVFFALSYVKSEPGTVCSK